MKESILTIDGSAGEGGGQVLRSSLAMSLVTGRTFVIANIRAGRKKPCLNERFRLPFLDEQMDRKIRGENISAGDLDWQFHQAQLAALEATLDRAFEESRLPTDPDRAAINEFLVRLRLQGGLCHK